MTEPQIRIISWGLGVCSTAMAVMSVLGDLPLVDAIVNCDPEWESPGTYKIRDWYMRWFEQHDMKAMSIPTGPVRSRALDSDCRVPFWTEKGSHLKRGCTSRFKQRPGKRIARQMLGYDERKPPHPPVGAIERWLGFTLDEWHRMKAAPEKFIKLEHPLVKHKITRSDCIQYFQDRNLPVPYRSACLCCPFRKASEWIPVRDKMPDAWAAAVAFDYSIRHRGYDAKRFKVNPGKLYLFRGPGQLPEALETAPLEEYAEREKTLEWFQMPLLCGDGGCWT